MSKKLLMNNYSENGLLPIQDGLICWLDAFDLTDKQGSLTWNDRTNNNNNGVFFYSLNDSAITITNGILEGRNYVNIPNPTKGLSNYTVEIGYEDISAKYWMGLWGNTSGSGSNYFNGLSLYQEAKKIGAYPINNVPPDIDAVKGGINYVVTTINSSQLTVYNNGIKLYSYNSSTQSTPKNLLPSEADYFCFMGRKPNSVSTNTNTATDYMKARWYYIRIYNRVLTDEEVLSNYNYELSLQRG